MCINQVHTETLNTLNTHTLWRLITITAGINGFLKEFIAPKMTIQLQKLQTQPTQQLHNQITIKITHFPEEKPS